MASEATSKPCRPSKPLTRSSLRHSLNFTSVGKALADVINKDPRDRDRVLKKAKEPSSRRLSLMTSTTLTHATTSQKPKSPTPPHGKEDSPSYKTITRRRQSLLLKQGTSSDEHGVKVADPSPSSPSRRSTLRSKTTSSTISSALPKYRPRSAVVEPIKKPLSPVRAGTRRRFSTSEEDDPDQRDSLNSRGTLRSTADKVERPISPLPHRALAVKVNLPSPTAPSTPTKPKTAQPSSARSGSSAARAGSARPAKTVKTAVTSSSATRPPSSASSCSSSRTHPSPLNPASFKNAFGFGYSKASSQNSSPMRSTLRQPPESPLAHQTRQAASVVSIGNNGKGSPVRPPQGNEGNSEDSVEIGDVELLLAPVASLAAPTPAIPRIRTTTCQSLGSELQTPPRPCSLLPTRANLSYLSPLPPSESSPVLRPRSRGNGQNLGSVFSWEQVAAESSQVLTREDLEGRLADVTAPFTPGGLSPSASTIGLDVPETPNLSALPSPSGYGSISQVLLPDVTPSPAVHHLTAVFETSVDLPPPADSGTITLLRLQIAQAESIAKERLSRLQELEEQLYAAKQCRIRETEELAGQISLLEQQLRASVETRERMDEERTAFTVSLQGELKRAQVLCDQAAQAGFERGQREARASWDAMLANAHNSWEASCATKEAALLWSSVKDQADEERSNIQSARQVLNIFMVVLDRNQKRLHGLLA